MGFIRHLGPWSALQRISVHAGNSSYTLQHGLMLLPYKFLYAAQLAEHGLISEAAQYCGAIQQALGAVPKLPPGLVVCRAFTQDLLERLQTYAAVSTSLLCAVAFVAYTLRSLYIPDPHISLKFPVS